MKKSLLLLISICSLCLLNGCGGGAAHTPPPVTVTTHLSISSPGAAAVGAPFIITVSALDATGNGVPTYSGTVHLTSSDTKAVLPPDSMLPEGSTNFNVTLKTVGNQTITATDLAAPSITGSSQTINTAAKVEIISGLPPNGVAGKPYGPLHTMCCGRGSGSFFQLAANATGTWSWAAALGSLLPPGVNCCSLTIKAPGPVIRPGSPGSTTYDGVISGVPQVGGTYNVVVSFLESETTNIATATYTILISAAQPAANATADHANSEKSQARHHMYRLIDVGTLGGPQSGFAVPASVTVNRGGIGTALADTPTPDPYSPNCLGQDCFVAHAAAWHNGIRIDLGALPGLNTSFPFGINDLGGVVGISENGLIDPLTGSPEVAAVYWKKGEIIDLGTFGGNASYAWAINNEGQIVGMALNTIPDSYSSGIGESIGGGPVFSPAFPVATQFRAFLWQHGVMHDLGTLGGNDAVASFVNDRGQVAGVSYTNTIANPSTGFPTEDPFFWEDGKMMDIGSLGGTQGLALGLNNRGQVVGSSNLPGDKGLRPFLWDKKEGLRDLGSLGGTIAGAQAVNDTGTVVGISSLPGDQVFHSFLWENGAMTDLGVPPGKESSHALSINASGQVVGESWIGDGSVGPYAGWLWETSGPIVDLNQLVLPGSDVTVLGASFINDRGEIAGEGLLPNGDVHAILLIPDGDCDDACEARIEASHINPAAVPVRAMTSGQKRNRRAGSTRRFPSPNL